MINRFSIILGLLLIACNSGNPDQQEIEVNEPVSDVKEAVKDSSDIPAAKNDGFNLSNFQSLVEQYEDPERALWQNPELIVNKLTPLNDRVVADIGAGSGYFTFRLAKHGAKVIAIDIEERFLEYIENRKNELEELIDPALIETRLAQEDDPLLKPAEADVALLVNTYHFIENRTDYLNKVIAGLAPNGQLVIVDYKSGELPVGPAEEYKISQQTAEQEITKAGLKILEVDSKSLTYQYMIIAKK